jgi:Calcineurin-like phosphoesterase
LPNYSKKILITTTEFIYSLDRALCLGFFSSSRLRVFLMVGLLIIYIFSASISFEPSYSLSDFNFAAAGDWGCNSNTDKTVNNMIGKNPELVLGLGDYSYQDTATCWLNKIKPIDSITKISIGNHEDEVSEGFNQYMGHFGLSVPYYSYNYQNVHVLTMLWQPSYSSGSAQYNFVVNDLQSASQNPNVDWIIVNIHDWIYRSSSSNPLNDDFAEIYHPIFDQYDVDLVLSGHDHSYHRTYPINYNPSNPTNPIITSTNAKDYTDPQGEIYAVVGTGGINLGPISGKSPFVAREQDDFFGQLDIKFTNNGAKLEGRFYPNGGGSTLGSLVSQRR